MSKQKYKTRDLYEASVLHAMNIPLVRLDWQGDECHFVFENKTTAEKKSQKHLNGELEANSRDLVMAIKRLKEKLFSNR